MGPLIFVIGPLWRLKKVFYVVDENDKTWKSSPKFIINYAKSLGPKKEIKKILNLKEDGSIVWLHLLQSKNIWLKILCFILLFMVLSGHEACNRPHLVGFILDRGAFDNRLLIVLVFTWLDRQLRGDLQEKKKLLWPFDRDRVWLIKINDIVNKGMWLVLSRKGSVN